MTNKEALQEVAQEQLSDLTIEKAFLDKGGVSAGAEYVKANEQTVDEIAIKVLSNIIEKNISEGGYSVSYNGAISAKVARLKLKWDIDQAAGPVITDVSKMW